MRSCPPTSSATQSLLERIAFIQHTHYGGFWDFTSSSIPTDTAYTSQPLAVHTDTTYLSVPCGLQMFHLLSHTNGAGGESLFVDGYAAAAYLRERYPPYYACLSSVSVLFHASGNTEVGELENSAGGRLGNPVFGGADTYQFSYFRRLKSGRWAEKAQRRKLPVQIRWNNDDRDAQRWPSLRSMEEWHKAARAWSRILKMKEFEIKVKLKPGQPIIFDNWRYLHGRTGFSGERRICGGYSKLCHFDQFQFSLFTLCLDCLRFKHLIVELPNRRPPPRLARNIGICITRKQARKFLSLSQRFRLLTLKLNITFCGLLNMLTRYQIKSTWTTSLRVTA